MTTPISYTAAGVDLDAADEIVRRIRPHAQSTTRSEVLGGIGAFGGLFELAVERIEHPVLVLSTDGAGTKPVVARALGQHDTIGIDVVAMCVDDIAAQGAEPLFFLDTITLGWADPDLVDDLVAGVAEGCRQAGCALIGGEVAEHPGLMEKGEYDIVGFAVGVVERHRLIDGSAVVAGDVLIGLPSPGVRCNGYSLARRTLGDAVPALLEPSVIYAPRVVDAAQAYDVHGIAHITGGGIAGNVVRMLPEGCRAVIDRSSWTVPPIFDDIALAGPVADAEMFRVFNMGIGMVLACAVDAVDPIVASLRDAIVIGHVEAGHREVLL